MMITVGASRVASGLLCLHAIAITPPGSMKLVRSSISIDCGLPCVTVRSTPAIVFSGPAQRSLMLWPACSRSRLATLYTESSDSFVASAAASIATGWSEPVPGRELHPLKSSAFSRRTVTPTILFRYPQIPATPRLSLTYPCNPAHDCNYLQIDGQHRIGSLPRFGRICLCTLPGTSFLFPFLKVRFRKETPNVLIRCLPGLTPAAWVD
jgi:hypothetical protein